MPVNSNLSLLVFIGVGFLLPLLVDIVTKRLASGAVKSSVLLLLSLVAGLLGEYLNALNTDTAFGWQEALFATAVAFVTGVASFYGLTNPVGLSGKTGAIQAAIPGGVGTDQPGKHVADDGE